MSLLGPEGPEIEARQILYRGTKGVWNAYRKPTSPKARQREKSNEKTGNSHYFLKLTLLL